MTILELASLVGLASLAAGFLGSLTGLGGGVVIVPLLTLGFGIDLRYAIGASLVSVIATSSGAAATYVKEGFTNLRVGMLLEIATTLGALVGVVVGAIAPTSAIAIIFGITMIYSAYQSRHGIHNQDEPEDAPADPIATRFRLDGTMPTAKGPRGYRVRRVRLGFALMFLAGILSALLGIGSGAVKVLAMDRAMGLPFRVSTTTSNFMIGVTAAASAGLYLRNGYIDPGLAMPVMLGVTIGAFLGTRFLTRMRVGGLRLIFSLVIFALGAEMLYKGISGNL